jgi:two-component system sensor histidine kinase YesM
MLEEDIEALNRSLVSGDRDSHGVGNVNRRIELICGPEYGLKYEKNENGGLCVTIRLPAVPSGEGEDCTQS